jgi:hypothetical protein
MLLDEQAYLAHYGILRKSGRYPWGSGGPEFASNRGFLGMVTDLKKQGLSETEIAKGLGINTTQLRAARSIAKNEEKQSDIAMAQRLKDKGYSNVAIGKRMGLRESSVRALLTPGQKTKVDILETTANMLKGQVEKKGLLDVGIGVEHHIGVSRTRLDTAIARLKEEGYELHNIQIDQLGTNNKTNVKVLAPPGTKYSDIVKDKSKIKSITDFSDDGGRSWSGIQPPISVNSKRIGVRYAEQGGADADGVIYVRPGIEDISLGNNRYAQVRISVDGTHYLKGMAVYKDDLPDGVDLVFNTNKKNTGNKLDAMKSLKSDPENPFGSVVRQLPKLDANGRPIKDTVRSAMNIVNDEADWEKWSRNLSSQFLSKQSPTLAKTQLDMTYERRKNELNEILRLTNPAVRKKLLQSFSDSADSAAVHLKAAALPRQKTHVILPVNSLKENEIFAPGYRNGERVVLIRHPHGGTFEIPELVVNNRHPEARKLIGVDTSVAVGINAKVAQKLSGADFDGDTVLVIPNNKGSVKTQPPLAGLKDFDPVSAYPKYEGMKPMTVSQKGMEMGDISNLITDMTIKGASNAELARAVRHSMVVIDAEKHELNWKLSAQVNGIAALKQRYQEGANKGAATLISRAKSREEVPRRTPRKAVDGGPIDPATGKKVFTPTGESYVNRRGKTIIRTETSTKLTEADDAHTLSSGKLIEKVYADHSNRLKDLANQARKELVRTKSVAYSPSAKSTYSKEVASLDAKLNLALRNAPLERQAQIIGNARYNQVLNANPDMEPSDKKKVKGQALNTARARVGAGKERIEITDSEWDAIQAGAISNNKLNQILDNADLDRLKKLATPKSKILMTPTKQRRALAMISSGYTRAEIADALGVSLTTLKLSLSE